MSVSTFCYECKKDSPPGSTQCIACGAQFEEYSAPNITGKIKKTTKIPVTVELGVAIDRTGARGRVFVESIQQD